MTFVNATLLLGLLGVGVPILVHLLMRETPRPVHIPTVAFIRRAAVRSQRRRRLTGLLLLSARILLVCFLVLAVSRPIWLHSPFRAMVRTRAAVVIILDDSFYTAQTEHGATQLAAARALALQVVDRLADGSKAAVFTTHTVADRLTHDLDFVRNVINQSRPQTCRADLARALARAGALLEREAGDLPRTVVVVADFNQGLLYGTAGRVPKPAGCRLIAVPVPRRAANAYIADAVVHRPDDLVVNREVTVDCRLGGGKPLAGRRVILEIGGRPVAEQTVRKLDADGRAHVSFSTVLSTVGETVGRLRLDAVDALPADNVWHFTLRPRPPSRILCVGNPPGPRPQQRDVLALAMAPPGWYGAQRFKVECGSDRFGWQDRDLNSFDIVVLTGRCTLPPKSWMALQQFVTQGGGLLVVPDATTSMEALNGGGLPLLPYRLAVMTPAQPVVLRALGNSLADRLMQVADGALGQVPFRTAAYLAAEGAPAGNVVHLLGWSDGSLAAASKRLGRGTSIVLGLSADPEWSELLRHPVFAPVLHVFLGALSRPSGGADDAACGRAIRLPAPTARGAGGELAVRLPEEAGEVRLYSGDFVHGEAVFDRTATPGIYRVVAGDATVDAFAANIPRTDRDYRYGDAGAIRDALGGDVLVAAAPATVATGGAAAAGPLPLAPMFAVLLMLLLPCEAYLGLRHRQARK